MNKKLEHETVWIALRLPDGQYPGIPLLDGLLGLLAQGLGHRV